MNILFVCTHGMNRSKYLAEYLREKGYTTDYGGVKEDGQNPLKQSQIEWSDIIITVRQKIKEKLLERFNVGDRKIISLEVIDNPKYFPYEQRIIAKDSWDAFQEQFVYPKLREQIQPYLKELE